MYYALIVVVIIGVVVYACLKKKRGNTEKPKEKKPDNDGNHTEITVNVPTESKGYIVEDGVKKEVTIKYMPQGLQVFDENGVCVLDLTEYICRIIGKRKISKNETTGRIEIAGGGRPYFTVISIDEPKILKGVNATHEDPVYPPIPVFSVANGVITWKYHRPINQRSGVTIMYGIA